MYLWIKLLLTTLLISFFVIACESSSPPGAISNPPIITNPVNPAVLNGNTPFVRAGINGSLTGEVWSADAGTRLNLATGEVKHVSQGRAYPRPDGLEYAELFEDFKFYSESGCGGFPTNSYAIFIRDTLTNEVKDSIETFARLSGPVLLSPDGDTLAVLATDDDVCSDQRTYLVTLMSRDGEVIVQGNENVVGYDWMPDGRLAFMLFDDGDYVLVLQSQPGTLRGFATASLTNLDGFASRFRISPDGSQVMIEVITEVPLALSGLEFREATVWQMNIDGTNLRKLVDTSRVSSFNAAEFAEPRVNEPVWSPDGQHMLVTENYTLGAAVSYYGTETENLTYIESVDITPINNDDVTYVLPTDTDFQRLPPADYSDTGVRPLFALDAQGRNGIVGIRPIRRQVWTPPIENSIYSGGAFPAPNGQVNRGLSGTLYLGSVRESGMSGIPVESMDLTTGTITTRFLSIEDNSIFVSGFDVSADESRIAALHTDSELINIYNADGEELESYAQITSDYDYEAQGQIAFSPVNENKIAWLFGDRNSSIQGVVFLDTQLDRFLNVFDDRDYDTFAFMPNGDLLLVSGNQVYLATFSGILFLNPVLAFEHKENIENLAVRSTDNRIAFSSKGRIFTIDADGSSVRTVTAPSDFFYTSPGWSPDGATLLFTGQPVDTSFAASASTFFVSGEAQNVTLYGNYIQNNIMRLGESSALSDSLEGWGIWR